MTVDTLITGGRLVGPDGTLDASIAISGEEIVAIGSPEDLPAADEEIDAPGKLVLPGAVDAHIHLDDHFSNDTYETASKAAALGGTTTMLDFAWQAWVSEASISMKRVHSSRESNASRRKPKTRWLTIASMERSLVRILLCSTNSRR